MITFGIITNSKHHGSTDQSERLSAMISSIQQQKIPQYEIIIVGDYKTSETNCKCVDFDESIKPAWITRKKNIIAQEAKYDHIAYLHDYIILHPNWYSGWQMFGFDGWDVGMNIIVNKDGSRFRDWIVFEYDGNMGGNGVWPNNIPKTKDCLISPYIPPYDYTEIKKMYISGSYWIVRKEVMLAEPLDEDFVWGQPEDIEWSFGRVLQKYKYVMNTKSAVCLLHYKDPVWKPIYPYFMSKEYLDEVCFSKYKGNPLQ